MAQDVFSYDNNVKTDGQVASSDFARISVGTGARNSLVQSMDVRYQQQIEEITQVGDTQIYWLPGRPQGRIGVQSLVGSNGFFSDWKTPCGKINIASVRVQGGRCGFNGSGLLTFEGAVVEGLNAQMSAGRQTIAQGADIRVASMRAS